MGDDIQVDVVRVFTNESGAFGNPLGIVWSSEATAGGEQALAAELGYSETVFLDAVTDDSAAIRIFTPAVELPFAGHPTVGTAWWLHQHGHPVTSLAVPAGRLDVATDAIGTWITGRASWAPEFTWHPLATPADVDAAFAGDYTEGAHYLWAWIDEERGVLRSRMFGPAMGVPEDEATGAGAVRLTALLERDLVIHQGEGSVLRTRALGDDLVVIGGSTVADASRTIRPHAAPKSGIFGR